MIMKSSHFLLFCVLATASYVIFYQHISVASSLNFLPGRRQVREWGLPFSNPKSEYQKIQEVDEETKRSTMQEDSSAVEQMSSSENSEENVYHIDYHGVMTHPTPTPKHPQP